MRISIIALASAALLGMAAAVASAPAAAKTTAECNQQYIANKDAIEASGQNQKDFVKACRAGKATIPRPAAAEKPAASAQAPAAGGEDAEALRKAAQNPIANLISVPFQNNTNFSVGPYHQTQNVLNIQPVIPFHITDDWNLITRWITPVVYQPRLSPEDGPEFGLGNRISDACGRRHF